MDLIKIAEEAFATGKKFPEFKAGDTKERPVRACREAAVGPPFALTENKCYIRGRFRNNQLHTRICSKTRKEFIASAARPRKAMVQ